MGEPAAGADDSGLASVVRDYRRRALRLIDGKLTRLAGRAATENRKRHGRIGLWGKLSMLPIGKW